jgi:hypothetical protein
MRVMKITMDWKRMGFKTEKEYNDFLESKWQSLKLKLKEPKIAAVFKRLKDR